LGQTTGTQSQSTTTTPSTTPSAQTDTPPTATPTDTVPPKKKVKHVYTSDDMKPADPNDIPSAASSSASGTAGAGANAGDAAKDNKDSNPKKKAKPADPDAIAAQQAKVDEAKKQVDGLTGIVANLQRLINDQPSRAQTIGEGLQMQQNNLVDAKKQLTDAQQQLDAMKNPK
jgi:hypothetical protein